MSAATIERAEGTPYEITQRAFAARCHLIDALAELEGLPPHPERTRVGRKMLDAYHEFGAWIEAGGHLGDGYTERTSP